jgi:exosortase/archaeosortase
MEALRLLKQTLIAGVLHFVASVVCNYVARGFDLDQVTSRSALATAAASVVSVLEYPHNAGIRALPNDWLVSLTPSLGAIYVIHSFIWGFMLCITWRLLRSVRTPAHGPNAGPV